MGRSNGVITWPEWVEAMADDNMAARISVLGIDTKDIHMLFKLLDVDDDGFVDIIELVEGFYRFKGPAHSLDMHQCLHEVGKCYSLSEQLLRRLSIVETGLTAVVSLSLSVNQGVLDPDLREMQELALQQLTAPPERGSSRRGSTSSTGSVDERT